VGLPARQEKVLESIETALRESDPKLAAFYATFTRLTTGEEMPKFEQLRRRAGRMLASLRRFAIILIGVLLLRRRRQRSVVLFLPLAVAVVSTSILLAVRSGNSPGCTTVRSVAATRNQSRSQLCMQTPPPVGH
jgi:hypothetical protein